MALSTESGLELRVRADVRTGMEWSDVNTPARTNVSVAEIEEQAALLMALSAQRLALGDKVAAAKYGSEIPINDEAREERLLADVVARSREIGLDPVLSHRFFKSQIEANKVLQRRLHALWADHPELRPRHSPDLESEVRPQLDAITKKMLFRLKSLQCAKKAADRLDGALRESLHDVHEEALRIALVPIRERAAALVTSDDGCRESSVGEAPAA
ncbi:gamma subclass chorismate mutase AroQ [Micromonospora azadirachtae]|uniref:chorismate mutase n=1 Tax=Micromonospora azadirachtae TaxID=1970735 RepID=A0ABW2ZV32_9ACTN